MPTSEPDGTWERPIPLACPAHHSAYVSTLLLPHLDPTKWFACSAPGHGARWTVCRSSIAAPGWDDYAVTTPANGAKHHDWHRDWSAA